MSENMAIPLDAFAAFVLLLLFVIGGGFMEHKHLMFGHETGLALVAGLAISAMLHYIP